MKQRKYYEQPTVDLISLGLECILTLSTDLKPEGDYDDGNGWNE